MLTLPNTVAIDRDLIFYVGVNGAPLRASSVEMYIEDILIFGYCWNA